MAFLLLLKINVIFTVFIVLGIRLVTDPGKIGEPLRKFCVVTFGEFWSKPLLLCTPCMSSFWSMWTTFVMLLLFNGTIPLGGFFFLYIFTALCATFPAAFLWALYQRM